MSSGATELTRPVPLYMQVVQQLRAQIAAGEVPEGGVLPSQRQMMARWSISMQTASKVIGALKTEGLAIPSAGRDTIVAPGAAARIASAAQGAAHARADDLFSPARTEVATVRAAKVAAPGPVAEILGMPAGRRALQRSETIASDGQPTRLTVSWYPPAVADAAPHLADSQPLPAGALAYIAEVTGTRLRRTDEASTAETADDAKAEALGIPPGSPVLVVRARHYGADNKLVEYAETVIPPGHARSRSYVIMSG
jgi:DNA-binding GntR family transcriptional regulator